MVVVEWEDRVVDTGYTLDPVKVETNLVSEMEK